MKTTIGVSKRHVHLTKESLLQLFNSEELPVRNELKQPGQYASTLVVDLELNGKKIEHVRVCGPARGYNQIEISFEEADFFGVKPPVRKSGDIENSLGIKIIGPCGEIITDKGLILAQRHVHITSDEANKNGFVNNEKVIICKNGKELFDAFIKIEDPSYTEVHIDTYEELLYNLHQDEEVDVIKCGK